MIDQTPSPSLPVPSVLTRQASNIILTLSFLLLIILLAATGQVDHPTLAIVHNFTDPLIDYVGDVGNFLGKGVTLVLLSLVIGGVGLWTQSEHWKFAGFHSLLAHGIAALVTQIIKHSLSRPRPRLMDTTEWEIRPTLQSGLDSFPSGHTSGSFSMAMVLAYYFPKWRVLWFGLASFNAMCRVIKGSHFPTDVIAGMLIGIGCSLVLVYAKKEWKEAIVSALAHGLPWLVTAFGLLWILVPHPSIDLEPNISLCIGLVLLMVGLALRLWKIRESAFKHPNSDRKTPTWPRLLMGLGLASTTGSLMVVGTSLLAGITWWIGAQSEPPYKTESQTNFVASLNPIWTEAVLGMGMLLIAIMS